MALRNCICVRKHSKKTSAVDWSMLALLYYEEDGRCHGVLRLLAEAGEGASRT